MIGQDQETIDQLRETFNQNIRENASSSEGVKEDKDSPGISHQRLTQKESRQISGLLEYPKYIPPVQKLRQEKNVQSSAKAVTEKAEATGGAVQRHLDMIKGLSLGRRMRGFRITDDQFKEDEKKQKKPLKLSLDELQKKIEASLGEGGKALDEKRFGEFLAYTKQYLIEIAKKHIAADDSMQSEMLRRLAAIYTGGEIEDDVFVSIIGSYDGSGDIATLADNVVKDALKKKTPKQTEEEVFDQEGVPEKMEELAFAARLLDQTRYLSQMSPFGNQKPNQVNEALMMQTLAGVSAEIIYDHRHGYLPTAFTRGSSFDDFEGGDGFYAILLRL